jgi:hypothetical protein
VEEGKMVAGNGMESDIPAFYGMKYMTAGNDEGGIRRIGGVVNRGVSYPEQRNT